MSKNRFETLLNCLRFDDASTRDERRSTDKAAPISQLFEKLIQNCKEVCSIGSYACIDEMLVAFRGRCSFKMYMPKKPNKYGLKIMCMTDAKNGYLVDAYIYLGKDSDSHGLPIEYQRLNKPTQAVLRLVASIEGTHRNVTTDNRFTSVELMNILKQKQLTLVGTLKKIKGKYLLNFCLAVIGMLALRLLDSRQMQHCYLLYQSKTNPCLFFPACITHQPSIHKSKSQK